jgi:hypothetical protein
MGTVETGQTPGTIDTALALHARVIGDRSGDHARRAGLLVDADEPVLRLVTYPQATRPT